MSVFDDVKNNLVGDNSDHRPAGVMTEQEFRAVVTPEQKAAITRLQQFGNHISSFDQRVYITGVREDGIPDYATITMWKSILSLDKGDDGMPMYGNGDKADIENGMINASFIDGLEKFKKKYPERFKTDDPKHPAILTDSQILDLRGLEGLSPIKGSPEFDKAVGVTHGVIKGLTFGQVDAFKKEMETARQEGSWADNASDLGEFASGFIGGGGKLIGEVAVGVPVKIVGAVASRAGVTRVITGVAEAMPATQRAASGLSNVMSHVSRFANPIIGGVGGAIDDAGAWMRGIVKADKAVVKNAATNLVKEDEAANTAMETYNTAAAKASTVGEKIAANELKQAADRAAKAAEQARIAADEAAKAGKIKGKDHLVIGALGAGLRVVGRLEQGYGVYEIGRGVLHPHQGSSMGLSGGQYMQITSINDYMNYEDCKDKAVNAGQDPKASCAVPPGELLISRPMPTPTPTDGKPTPQQPAK